MNADQTSVRVKPSSLGRVGEKCCRRRRLLARTACLLAVGVGLILTAPAGATPARPASAGTASFTFSGAASGTLHVTSANLICSGSKAGPSGGIFDSLGKLKGPKTVSWAIHVNTLALGNFKIRANSVPYVSVQYTTDSGPGPLWTSRSGTLTAGGTSSTFTGSFSIGFSRAKAHALHVSGSWTCHIV